MSKLIVTFVLITFCSSSCCQSHQTSDALSHEVIVLFNTAVSNNDIPTVKKLLEENRALVDYEPVSPDEKTPLQRALTNNHPEMVKILVDAGVNVNSEKHTEDGIFCNTAFYEGFYDCARILLLAGAEQYTGDLRGKQRFFFEAVKRDDYEALDKLRFKEGEINKHDCEGMTALIIAVIDNDIEMVRYLLSKGADKNKRITLDCDDVISYGESPYEIAEKNGNKQMISLLK